jgi:hypothetical protein
MNWKKHILAAAISLNCVLYLGTAIGIIFKNTQKTEDELFRLAARSHETLHMELLNVGGAVKEMLSQYHRGSLNMNEKRPPPESPLLELVDVSQIISGKLEHLPAFNHPVSIPLLLLENTEPYSLMYFDKVKYLYMIGPLEINDKNKPSTPYNYLITYKIQKEKWLEKISANGPIHLSIIEQDSNMNPFVVFTNLDKKDKDELLLQSPLRSNSAYKEVSRNQSNLQPQNSVFKSTLSGTKTITYPFVLNTTPDIQQVIYYTVPVPNFYSISIESVFALVAALLATFTAALFAGVYVVKTAGKEMKSTKSLTAFSVLLSILFFAAIYYKTDGDPSQKTTKVILLLIFLSSLSISALAYYYQGRQKGHIRT